MPLTAHFRQLMWSLPLLLAASIPASASDCESVAATSSNESQLVSGRNQNLLVDGRKFEVALVGDNLAKNLCEAKRAKLGLQLKSKLGERWTVMARADRELQLGDPSQVAPKSSSRLELGLKGSFAGLDLTATNTQSKAAGQVSKLSLKRTQGPLKLDADWTRKAHGGTNLRTRGRFALSRRLQSRVVLSRKGSDQSWSDGAKLSLERRFGLGGLALTREIEWRGGQPHGQTTDLRFRSRKLGSWILVAGAEQHVPQRAGQPPKSRVYLSPTLKNRDLEFKMKWKLNASSPTSSESVLAESSLGWKPSQEDTTVQELRISLAVRGDGLAELPADRAEAEVSIILHVGG